MAHQHRHWEQARAPATSQRYPWVAPEPTQPTNPSASPARKDAVRTSAAAAKKICKIASKNFASVRKPLDSFPADKPKAAPAVDQAAASAAPVDSVVAARSRSDASAGASTSTNRTASSISP